MALGCGGLACLSQTGPRHRVYKPSRSTISSRARGKFPKRLFRRSLQPNISNSRLYSNWSPFCIIADVLFTWTPAGTIIRTSLTSPPRPPSPTDLLDGLIVAGFTWSQAFYEQLTSPWTTSLRSRILWMPLEISCSITGRWTELSVMTSTSSMSRPLGWTHHRG